jgi:DNA polymerase (family X)
LSIPGLRPDKAMKLYKELGIKTIDELKHAAQTEQSKNVKGFGAAFQRKIIEGLKVRQSAKSARHLHRAENLLFAAKENLKRSNLGLKRITFAGDFRRGCELISDLALVAQAPPSVKEKTLKLGEVHVYLRGPKHFGSQLLFATGRQTISTSFVRWPMKMG